MGYFLESLTSRWVAGETIESAVRVCNRLNRSGVKALLNYIGEHHKDKVLVERAVGMYLELLENIRIGGLNADLTLKLTELGLDIGKGYCLRNLLELLHRAKELGVMVWIDMESSDYTKDSIDIYRDVVTHYKNSGITLQANMKRTRNDLLEILKKKGKVRLVKGAYKGDVTDWDDIEVNYSRLLRMLFAKGDQFAVATHDEILLEEAKILNERYRKHFEFQLLRGVKRKAALQLKRQGYQVGEYTPFGRKSLPYVWRRIKEHGFAMVL